MVRLCLSANNDCKLSNNITTVLSLPSPPHRSSLPTVPLVTFLRLRLDLSRHSLVLQVMSLQDLVRSLLSWDSLSWLCKSPYSFLPIVHASHLRIAISLDKNGRHRRATRPGKVKLEEMLNEARPRRRATVDCGRADYQRSR